jgi:hypothetical protein
MKQIELCGFLKIRSPSSSKRDSCVDSELLHISQDSAHVLHYPPPPPAHSFLLGSAVINIIRIPASGSPTLGMLVEMLVERVFLVSGVVKTVFLVFKKNKRFFCFSPRTKGSKAGLRGNFQIASFPYGNAENIFYNFVVLFFSFKETAGEILCRGGGGWIEVLIF